MAERNIFVELANLWIPHPELQAAQVHILIKGIPDFISDTGPEWDDWLPPPIAYDQHQVVREWRGVIVVESHAELTFPRYDKTLASYSGAAWAGERVEQFLHIMEDALIEGELRRVGWEYDGEETRDGQATSRSAPAVRRGAPQG